MLLFIICLVPFCLSFTISTQSPTIKELSCPAYPPNSDFSKPWCPLDGRNPRCRVINNKKFCVCLPSAKLVINADGTDHWEYSKECGNCVVEEDCKEKPLCCADWDLACQFKYNFDKCPAGTLCLPSCCASKPGFSTCRTPCKSALPCPTETPTQKPTKEEKTARPTVSHPTRSPVTPKPTRPEKTRKPSRPPVVFNRTNRPTRSPLPKNTPKPTNEKTNRPTRSPIEKATPKPTPEKTLRPTRSPLPKKTRKPTPEKTLKPTRSPIEKETLKPTTSPITCPAVFPNDINPFCPANGNHICARKQTPVGFETCVCLPNIRFATNGKVEYSKKCGNCVKQEQCPTAPVAHCCPPGDVACQLFNPTFIKCDAGLLCLPSCCPGNGLPTCRKPCDIPLNTEECIE